MKHVDANPSEQREFALDVVLRLRNAGFEALWAGGCVRDDLLGFTPDDYDVATNAKPQEVIEVFGARKTVAVGVSFGVVMVLGPNKRCGQVEVATFRADGEYLDGRRPSAVTFCSAEEDAKRRDFTVNGMFFDPVAMEVIDYVGGRRDLESKIVRAIGDPKARFTEDKLRMLRAVRFAATYDFELEHVTADAVCEMSKDILQVSVERIAQELRRMLSHTSRAVAWRQLAKLGLLSVLFPDAFASEETDVYCNVLKFLREPRFEPSMAILLASLYRPDIQPQQSRLADVRRVCRQLKLANSESDCIGWLIENEVLFRDPQSLPLHVLKPILANSWQPLLIDVVRARDEGSVGFSDAAQFIGDYLARTSPETLAPPVLVGGEDVRDLNVPSGPAFGELLTTVRNEQLDGLLTTREQALLRLAELAKRRA